MKKISLILTAGLILVAVLVTGCGYVSASGSSVTREYDFRDFDRIEISNAFRFDITRSDDYSLTISTRESIVKHLDINQSGDTVIIRLKSGRFTNAETRAVVTLPELEKLVVSGASQGEVKGFKSTDDLEVRASGASRIEMEVEAGDTVVEVSGASKVTGSLLAINSDFNISGASRCELTGSAKDGKFDVSGASQSLTGDFQLQTARAAVSGASKAQVNVSGTLDVDVSGASTLEYAGNPTLGKVNVNGASRLRNME